MTHAICTECGGGLWQSPQNADFRALFPVTFMIETPDSSVSCGVSCKLPRELLPTCHVNYENRLFDWLDGLPKYKLFEEDGVLLDDEGSPLTRSNEPLRDDSDSELAGSGISD